MSLIPLNNNSNKQEKYRLFGNYYANNDQIEALEKISKFINNKNDKSFVLTGAAGTGKTTIMKKALKSTGLKVYGATISHQAKTILGKQLGDDYVCTVASLLGIKLNEETGKFTEDKKLKPRINYMKAGILVIDETSMISEELMDNILDKCPSGLKIIWVGDPNQLPPIGQESGISSTFMLYDNKEYNKSHLSEIMRFGDKVSTTALEISKGIIDYKSVNLVRNTDYDEISREGVIFVRDEQTMLDMAAEDFKKNPKGTKIITYNNHRNRHPQSVLSLNNKIRELLYPNATTPIMPNEIFTMYNPFYDPEQDEKILAQNSESFIVKSYNKTTIEVNVSVHSHKMGRRDFKANYNDVYEAECVFDDKTLILELIFDPQYKKDLDKIAKTSDWQLFYGLQKQFPQIEYGYSCSTHKAQGSGYDNIYVCEDNIMTSPQSQENLYRTFYTAVTRAKKKLVIQSLDKNIL